MQQIPRKTYYRMSEVCEYTDTQPYVLRFWESEFPQLSPTTQSGGQPVYRRTDIELVRRIKELLYDEQHSLDSARDRLAKELAQGKALPRAKPQAVPDVTSHRPAGKPPTLADSAPRRKMQSSPPPASAIPAGSVSRQRYEAAVEEIDHLRLTLDEAKMNQRHAEALTEAAQEKAERERMRVETAIRHLERVEQALAHGDTTPDS